MTHWHAGWNMIGYLPEMDPSYPFESFQDAKASMIDDLERAAENMDSWVEPHECEDIPCPTYGDDCPHDLAGGLSLEAEDLNLSNGPGWDAYVGNMHYWIAECDERECEGES